MNYTALLSKLILVQIFLNDDLDFGPSAQLCPFETLDDAVLDFPAFPAGTLPWLGKLFAIHISTSSCLMHLQSGHCSRFVLLRRTMLF